MATEMCAGNLHDLYNGRYNGPEVGDCRSVLSQITTGLQYLHSLEIVHGNLKPSNILISIPKDHSSPKMKLADFGLSHAVRNQDDTDYEDQFRPACSDGWSPFDADGGKRNASFDTFSLGLLFAFAALKGVHPFGRDLKEAKEHIRNRDPMSLNVKEIDPNIRSEQFLKLLAKMICYDPSQRPTSSQILAHPFFILQPIMAPARQQHLEDAPTLEPSATLPSTSEARQPNGEAQVKKVKNPSRADQVANDEPRVREPSNSSEDESLEMTNSPPSSYFHRSSNSSSSAKRVRRDEPYECEECLKQFTTQGALCNHLKSHSAASYECEFCGKMFFRLSILKRHRDGNNQQGGRIACKVRREQLDGGM